MTRSLLLLVLFAALPSAQSLVGLDASGSLVYELTGPKRQIWNGPTARILELWPTVTMSACPTPIAFAPPPSLFGDVAVDGKLDRVWVTDGATIAEYEPDGTLLRAFPQLVFATPISGLGMDAELGELWITDGFQAARILPPTEACGGVATVTVGPLTLFSTAPPNPATDIEWDPYTSSLWVCDTLGNVGNLNTDGSLGPEGGFVATGVCGLTPPLTGVAVDVTRSPVRIFVTDGTRIAYFEPNGTLAEPTFGTTSECQAATGEMLGLAFASRAVAFGVGSSTSGAPPAIHSSGQAIPGNGNFFVELRKAAPISLATLYVSPHAVCPLGTFELMALPRLGCDWGPVGLYFVDSEGRASSPQSVPASFPTGRQMVFHWVVMDASLQYAWSDRLMVTAGGI
ncbi:MAG: hypothetical protein WD226_05315 [Planctomycetota bacterium]